MARRRSKWRRTWQTLKKMMQEARRVRAHQSLRQCPACGNPYSLTITIKVDKESDRRSAEVVCNACGFEYRFTEIPTIADEFWVYSKVLDVVQSGGLSSSVAKVETEKEGKAEVVAEATVEEVPGEEEISIDVEEEEDI